jgi:UDP:flavonoid glycosyltransferase YjiC (YdhE family)
MQVVGSRGDVQPFVALGKVLKEKYGHKIRLATHPIFQEFIEENGLEFFSLGGDPVALMAFMVKNPKFLPSMGSIRNGDAIRQSGQMFEIFKGCWRACIETGDGILSRTG